MKKSTKKQIEHIKYISRKVYKKRKHRIRKRKHNIKEKYKIIKNDNNNFRTILPEVFSIIDNPEQTIDCFNKIIYHISQKDSINIFFDLTNIKQISIDAIMYMLAVIRNIKVSMQKEYKFNGNFPKKDDVRTKFAKSGFLEYIRNNVMELDHIGSNTLIKTGSNIDNLAAKEMCNFAQHSLGMSRIDTVCLYTSIIEMMGNTDNHAYNDNIHILEKVWYMYGEINNKRVDFTFLDTGLGIPQTVTKKVGERVKLLFKIDTLSDAEFTLSAFNSKFRTQTKLWYRGNGLPEIYKNCKNGYLKKMRIISGRGICEIGIENDKTTNLKKPLSGTIYVWHISKEAI